MTNIKYILINETDCKNPFCDAQHRDVPNVGHCIECFAVPGFKVQESARRLSKNSVAFVGTTPKPLYWECQNWTPLVPMLPSESIQK